MAQFDMRSSPSGASAEPGSRMSDYVVERALGHGATGTVYKCVCTAGRLRRRTVAVKVVRKETLLDGARLARIRAEVAVHARLAGTDPALNGYGQIERRHRHILGYEHAFEDDDAVYIVTEYCSGATLFSHMQENAPTGLPEGDVRSIMRDVASAVAFLHERGVVHRDLKLTNVLLDDDRRVKIADFGLATTIDSGAGAITSEDGGENGELDGDVTVCGTPNYVSPEVLARTRCGYAADCWSLGCILVALLTGKPPFQGAQVGETLHLVRKGAYRPLPRTASKKAKSLVHALLQVDPAARLTAQQVQRHPFLGGLSSSTSSGSTGSIAQWHPGPILLKSSPPPMPAFPFAPDVRDVGPVMVMAEPEEEERVYSAPAPIHAVTQRRPDPSTAAAKAKRLLGLHSRSQTRSRSEQPAIAKTKSPPPPPLPVVLPEHNAADTAKPWENEIQDHVGLAVSRMAIRANSAPMTAQAPHVSTNGIKGAPRSSSVAPTTGPLVESIPHVDDAFVSKHRFTTDGVPASEHRTKRGVFVVRDDGWVRVRLVHDSLELQISPDGGSVIVVDQRNGGQPITTTYALADLPARLMPGYRYAGKTIAHLKTRRVLVALESDGAKCRLFADGHFECALAKEDVKVSHFHQSSSASSSVAAAVDGSAAEVKVADREKTIWRGQIDQVPEHIRDPVRQAMIWLQRCKDVCEEPPSPQLPNTQSIELPPAKTEPEARGRSAAAQKSNGHGRAASASLTAPSSPAQARTHAQTHAQTQAQTQTQLMRKFLTGIGWVEQVPETESGGNVWRFLFMDGVSLELRTRERLVTIDDDGGGAGGGGGVHTAGTGGAAGAEDRAKRVREYPLREDVKLPRELKARLKLCSQAMKAFL